MSGFKNVFDGLSVKNVTIPAAMAVLGWGGHTFLVFHDQETKLAAHDQQIAALSDGQVKTHTALDSLSDTIIRIEGKIDVLTTKIDDDRARHK